MKLLALDTASDACSVALMLDRRILRRHEVRARAHAELLLPMVRALLDEAGIALADLDALAFGRGPGAFTGLRIAAGVVQGLAFGARLPVIGVSDLAALAQGAFDRDGVSRAAVAVDARMGEIYWGVYRQGEDGLAHGVVPERVCPAEQAGLPADGRRWWGVGTGWRAYGDALAIATAGRGRQLDAGRLPDAADMLPLARAALDRGEALPPVQAVPVYLRENVVHGRR